MQFILSLIILSIVVFSFIRLKIGIAIYLAYLFLIPYMNVNFLGINLSYNFVNTVVLIAFIYEYKIRNKLSLDWGLFAPFLLYYILLLIVIPFQDGIPYSIALNQYRAEIMSYMILPFIMWHIIKREPSSIRMFRNIMFVCIMIITLYGLFLTTTNGLNPYVMIMSALNGSEFNEEYVMKGGGRMFGRLSSVFTHPMMFALNLGFFFVYLYSLKDRMSKYVWIIGMILIIVNIFTCGVRSVLGGVAIAIVYYLLTNRNLKILFYATLIGLIGYFIITNIPEMESYVSSIADANTTKTNVGGSSIGLRLEQLDGCINEISDCLMFGEGFGWTNYYMKIHEYGHPTLLAFESLIFVILCNWGIWGIFVWLIFLLQWYKSAKYNCSNSSVRLVRNEYTTIISLIVFYLTYSCITGEYGYMRYLLVFYVLMIGEIKYCNTCKLIKYE